MVNEMKINKNSWHYRLYVKSFDSEGEALLGTDLCRYCHRVFWQVVARVAMVSLIVLGTGLAIVGLGIGLYQHPIFFLAFFGVLAVIIGGIYLYTHWLNNRKPSSEPKTLVGKWMRARKQNVCPLVEFIPESSADEE